MTNDTPFYTFRQFYIPGRMEEGIERYIYDHVSTGEFLTSVFENNFIEACGRADDENLINLPAYAAFLYNKAPSACHGSRKKVEEWLSRRAPQD